MPPCHALALGFDRALALDVIGPDSELLELELEEDDSPLPLPLPKSSGRYRLPMLTLSSSSSPDMCKHDTNVTNILYICVYIYSLV